MNPLRNNWALILLLFITLILVVMLINLQSAIASQQLGDIPPDAGPLYALRRQLALMIAPPTFTPAFALPTPVSPTPAPLPATATTTQSLPTPLPAATATPTSTPAASTPTATVAPLPTVTDTPTAQPSATATLAASTPATPAAAALSPEDPSAQPTARADYRLGYFDRSDQCATVTEIVRLVLEQKLGLRAESVAFDTPDGLFATLAGKDEQSRIDLTLCYADPDDRSYLQKHLGFVLLVGGGYRKLDTRTYLILSNAAVKKVIQHDQPCVYSFLTHLNLADIDLATQNARAWYDTHADLVGSWTNCS